MGDSVSASQLAGPNLAKTWQVKAKATVDETGPSSGGTIRPGAHKGKSFTRMKELGEVKSRCAAFEPLCKKLNFGMVDMYD